MKISKYSILNKKISDEEVTIYVLQRVMEILRSSDNWLKEGPDAVDRFNRSVAPQSPSAIKFTMTGAANKVYSELFFEKYKGNFFSYTKLFDFLSTEVRKTKFVNIIEWSNNKNITHLKLMKRLEKSFENITKKYNEKNKENIKTDAKKKKTTAENCN